MPEIVLWGFDGSTYVRTVKMVLAEKGCTDFEQEPLDVLAGEPKQPEHLARHPFGKVPVLDYDGLRILETSAISPVPERRAARASRWFRRRRRTGRAWTWWSGSIDSYGYGASSAASQPTICSRISSAARTTRCAQAGLENGRKVLEYAMDHEGHRPFIAGELSLADLYLAPIAFYVSLTPDKDEALFGGGVSATGGPRSRPCRASARPSRSSGNRGRGRQWPELTAPAPAVARPSAPPAPPTAHTAPPRTGSPRH